MTQGFYILLNTESKKEGSGNSSFHKKFCTRFAKWKLDKRVTYKDCFEDCSSPGCNDKNTIGAKFDEGYGQESCFACKYAEQDNGDVIGNTNCLGKPNDADKMRFGLE